MFQKIMVLVFAGAAILLAGCSGGVSNVKWMPVPGMPDLTPHKGQVLVFWKSVGIPVAMKTKKYLHLGTVSGRSTWCGVTPPRQNEELQNHLIDLAGRHGGNAIMLDCGYGGQTEGSCYCYGDVLLFRK